MQTVGWSWIVMASVLVCALSFHYDPSEHSCKLSPTLLKSCHCAMALCLSMSSITEYSPLLSSSLARRLFRLKNKREPFSDSPVKPLYFQPTVFPGLTLYKKTLSPDANLHLFLPLELFWQRYKVTWNHQFSSAIVPHLQ